MRRALPVAVGAVASLALGCGLFGPDPTPPSRLVTDPMAPPPPFEAEPFSAERAWAHLVALSDLGPRPVGSTANQEAFEYIRTRLEELDLELIEIEYDGASGEGEGEGDDEAEADGDSDESDAKPADARPALRHLTAQIPGESPDSIMLIAHYDTFDGSPGANAGASGPAVLLELARQLRERPLPYTVELVFLDGDMLPRPPKKGEEVEEGAPPVPGLDGGRSLADYLDEAGTFDVVRLAVFFEQVGDADLTISRDLTSERFHREVFFDAAEALGYGASFPRGSGYVASEASHRAFLAKDMPRIMLLNDPWYGGDERPGEYYGAENDVRDHCAPQSLHTVGVVTLASLRRISAQLTKIDYVSGRAERRRQEALSRAQLSDEPVPELAPEADDAMDSESPEASPAPVASDEGGPEGAEVQPSGDTAPGAGADAPEGEGQTDGPSPAELPESS